MSLPPDDSEIGYTDMGYEGHGPWPYRKLSGSELSQELAQAVKAQTILGTDVVSVQFCANSPSQDRYIISTLDVPGGQWDFYGVFDGHAGEETVDYIVKILPSILHINLSAALRSTGEGALSHDMVSKVLVDAISELDDTITRDILDLFPGGLDAIEKMTDEQIDAIANDLESGGANNAKLLRGMRGSTVLVSLVDPAGTNLYVASLGDCQAVLGTRDSSGKWKASLLSRNHNGKDQGEVARILSEHPGEEETCVMEERVLGAIAVTRAIGDHEFRLPAAFTQHVFVKTKPGFKLSTDLTKWLPRNKSPPYLSNIAEVTHVDLASTEKKGRFLIMCSDGLTDMYVHDGNRRDVRTLDETADLLVLALADRPTSLGDNAASQLLRKAMGGDDEDKVAQYLTVQMAFRWMDDITILVRSL